MKIPFFFTLFICIYDNLVSITRNVWRITVICSIIFAMRLFVLSDTHGTIDKALAVYGNLSGIDLIVHLGDMVSDAVKISKITGKDVINVKGNNDFISFGSFE